MPVSELVTVGRAADFPPGTIRRVRAGDRELALAHADGSFHAVQPKCPHLGGPLGEGKLEGCVLTCPWHGWQFDLASGENEFDRAIAIETYEVVVEDGDVRVALPR